MHGYISCYRTVNSYAFNIYHRDHITTKRCINELITTHPKAAPLLIFIIFWTEDLIWTVRLHEWGERCVVLTEHVYNSNSCTICRYSLYSFRIIRDNSFCQSSWYTLPWSSHSGVYVSSSLAVSQKVHSIKCNPPPHISDRLQLQFDADLLLWWHFIETISFEMKEDLLLTSHT